MPDMGRRDTTASEHRTSGCSCPSKTEMRATAARQYECLPRRECESHPVPLSTRLHPRAHSGDHRRWACLAQRAWEARSCCPEGREVRANAPFHRCARSSHVQRMTSCPSSSPLLDASDQGGRRSRWWRRRGRGVSDDPDARANDRSSWWAAVLEVLGAIDWDFDD
jgi:hypothetical protein